MARVAFVVADDFEDKEFETPHTTLLEWGHEVDVIGLEAPLEVIGKHGTVCSIDTAVGEADPGAYDAVVIPGGYSPDHLRTNGAVVNLVASIGGAGKPTAAICHGPWLLIDAGLVRGRTVTSFPSLRTDLLNAGAQWVDRDVVVDANIITSRTPDDLPAFVHAVLDSLGDVDLSSDSSRSGTAHTA